MVDQRLRFGVCAAVAYAAALSAAPASASSTHYYYDAAGRFIGLTASGDGIRANVYDSADNRQTYSTFAAPPPSSSQGLQSGQVLLQAQGLVSGDGSHTLSFQEDGNLVLYHGSSGIWSTGTGSRSPAGVYLVMQTDGNLVLYDAQHNGIWSSGTQGNPGATLLVQGDGNLVIYSTSGQGVWSSQTNGK